MRPRNILGENAGLRFGFDRQAKDGNGIRNRRRKTPGRARDRVVLRRVSAKYSKHGRIPCKHATGLAGTKPREFSKESEGTRGSSVQIMAGVRVGVQALACLRTS